MAIHRDSIIDRSSWVLLILSLRASSVAAARGVILTGDDRTPAPSAL
jgi:hypothetical protein